MPSYCPTTSSSAFLSSFPALTRIYFNHPNFYIIILYSHQEPIPPETLRYEFLRDSPTALPLSLCLFSFLCLATSHIRRIIRISAIHNLFAWVVFAAHVSALHMMGCWFSISGARLPLDFHIHSHAKRLSPCLPVNSHFFTRSLATI